MEPQCCGENVMAYFTLEEAKCDEIIKVLISIYPICTYMLAEAVISYVASAMNINAAVLTYLSYIVPQTSVWDPVCSVQSTLVTKLT